MGPSPPPPSHISEVFGLLNERAKKASGEAEAQVRRNKRKAFLLQSHWLTFKLLGITYFIGQITFTLLFHGPVLWLSKYFCYKLICNMFDHVWSIKVDDATFIEIVSSSLSFTIRSTLKKGWRDAQISSKFSLSGCWKWTPTWKIWKVWLFAFHWSNKLRKYC